MEQKKDLGCTYKCNNKGGRHLKKCPCFICQNPDCGSVLILRSCCSLSLRACWLAETEAISHLSASLHPTKHNNQARMLLKVFVSPVLLVFLLVVLVFIFQISDTNAGVTLKREELPAFFKSTYILKQPGYVQPVDQTTASVSSKKPQYAHGFNPMWNIYRLHHVSKCKSKTM